MSDYHYIRVIRVWFKLSTKFNRRKYNPNALQDGAMTKLIIYEYKL